MNNFSELEKHSRYMKTAYNAYNSSIVPQEFKALMKELNIDVCLGCSGVSGVQNVADSIITTSVRYISAHFPEVSFDVNKYTAYRTIASRPNIDDMILSLTFRRLSSVQNEIRSNNNTFRRRGFTQEVIDAALKDVKQMALDRKDYILSDLVEDYKRKTSKKETAASDTDLAINEANVEAIEEQPVKSSRKKKK